MENNNKRSAEEDMSNLNYKGSVDWPKISIVTPSYNQGNFIERTIHSVVSQNYPNLEYIIIDGSSTDKTLDIIKKYESDINHWVSEPDNGQSHAINKGFDVATGQVYGWLNSDDYLLPKALYQIGRTFQEYKNIVGCVGSCNKVTEKGNLIEVIEPRNLDIDSVADWYIKGFFYQPACFFKADTFHKVGGVNEVLNFALDVELWLKLLKEGPFKKINYPIAAAHIHENMKTILDIEGRDLETAAVAVWHNKMPQARRRLQAYINLNLREELKFIDLINALKYRIQKKIKEFFKR